MSAKTFIHSYRVGYAECTVGNHIYYSRYLDILERARGEFFRHLGCTFDQWQQADAIFPVVEARLRYLGAAHYEDLLSVELWVSEMGRVRLSFGSRIAGPDGRTLVEVTTEHACTTLLNKPRRLPEELVASLAPYLHPGVQRSVPGDSG